MGVGLGFSFDARLMMEENSEYPKTYHGKYWDIVIPNKEKDAPERYKRMIDPEYQQKEYERILADIKKRYGKTLEQLKDL